MGQVLNIQRQPKACTSTSTGWRGWSWKFVWENELRCKDWRVPQRKYLRPWHNPGCKLILHHCNARSGNAISGCCIIHDYEDGCDGWGALSPRKSYPVTDEILTTVHTYAGWRGMTEGASTGINSSPPSAAYMRQWIRSTLVQIMACRLFGAKPLSEPVLGYCQLEP